MTPRDEQLRDEILAQRQEIEAPCNPSQFRVLKRLATNPENHLAVSFGGGSVPGIAANVALMTLLEELEIRPHVKEIWGTSAGAVCGASMAAGAAPHEVMDVLADLEKTGGVDFSWWELFKSLIRFIRYRKLPDGFVGGRYFCDGIRSVEKRHQIFTIEDCQIPLRLITCTDDGYCRKVILREGSIADGVFASMSIPGVMRPLDAWADQPHGYLDGGIVEKTPLISIIEDHARSGSSSQLMVIATHYPPQESEDGPQGFLSRFMHTMNVLEEDSWEMQLTKARPAPNCKFVILNPNMKVGSMFGFDLAEVNYLLARRSYKEQLSNAGLATRFDAR